MSELVVGVDFGGPATARAQRRKILAIAAQRISSARYVASGDGINARVLETLPGWTAEELAEMLVAAHRSIGVVAADFPFSIPAELLRREAFAALLGRAGAFPDWVSFNAAVAGALPLAPPYDFGPFAGWRDKRHWVKRGTDTVAHAHAPLKHQFQVMFNMTLVGNAFLHRLAQSGHFDVLPFQARGRTAVIEVYPGHMMRTLGVASYKRAPARSIDAAINHLAAYGIEVDVAPHVRAICESYSSGTKVAPDHDAADALVAAMMAILHREGHARELRTENDARAIEGAIWSV